MSEEQKPEEVRTSGVAQREDNPTVENPVPVDVQPEAPKVPTPEELAKIAKQRQFFNYLRAGAAFVSFVQKDIENMRRQKMNRHFRRRAEKDTRKGVFTPELVNMYAEKLDEIVAYIDAELAKLPVVPTTPVAEQPKENV